MITNILLTFAAFGCFLIYELQKAGICLKNAKINIWMITGTAVLVRVWLRLAKLYLCEETMAGIPAGIRQTAGLVAALVTGAVYVYLIWGIFRPMNSAGKKSRENKSQHDTETQPEAIRKGPYALCRHPGFYLFIIMSAFLAISVGSMQALIMAAIMSALNTLYIFIQDKYLFPLYLKGYEEYKNEVPFLAFWRRKPKQDLKH